MNDAVSSHNALSGEELKLIETAEPMIALMF